MSEDVFGIGSSNIGDGPCETITIMVLRGHNQQVKTSCITAHTDTISFLHKGKKKVDFGIHPTALQNPTCRHDCHRSCI